MSIGSSNVIYENFLLSSLRYHPSACSLLTNIGNIGWPSLHWMKYPFFALIWVVFSISTLKIQEFNLFGIGSINSPYSKVAGDSPRLWILNWPHWRPIKDSYHIIPHLSENQDFLMVPCLLGLLSINFYLDVSVVCFPIVIIKQWSKSTCVRKDTIWSCSSSPLSREGKGRTAGRNMEAEI